MYGTQNLASKITTIFWFNILICGLKMHGIFTKYIVIITWLEPSLTFDKTFYWVLFWTLSPKCLVSFLVNYFTYCAMHEYVFFYFVNIRESEMLNVSLQINQSINTQIIELQIHLSWNGKLNYV